MTTLQTIALTVWAGGAVFAVAFLYEAFKWASQFEDEECELDYLQMAIAVVTWPVVITDLVLMMLIGAVAVANIQAPPSDPKAFAQSVHDKFSAVVTITAWSMWIAVVWMLCMRP